ncbi:MAG: PD40 domain-containing protein [Phycisphaerales bacterium]|nr:PD40 domain-containing protein [Phycisphaerales bacterium]
MSGEGVRWPDIARRAAAHVVLAAAVLVTGCGVSRDVEIRSKPSGATVWIGDVQRGRTPLTVELTWPKPDDKGSKGKAHTLRLTMSKHEDVTEQLYAGDAVKAANPWVIERDLLLLEQRTPVNITTNVEGATVKVNGDVVGETPLRHTFEFRRSGRADDWNTFLLTIEKDGYRYRRPGGPVSPGDTSSYSTTLTIEKASTGELVVDLEPIQFVRTRIGRWGWSEEGIERFEEVKLSQVGEIETEPKVQSVTRITDMKPDDAFMETRISVGRDGEVLYSIPFRLRLASRSSGSGVYSNLWSQLGGGNTRLTDGRQIDLEATLSPDGEWIYFASNRLRPDRVNLWRVSTGTARGLTKITDSPSSLADTEPSVSPDGTKVAYTAYMRDATMPHIWIANADGTLPTQMRVGRNPSWSSDGTKLAFVASDAGGHDQIWVMGSDGSSPTQLTKGDNAHQYPVWTTDGRRIVYACDQVVNDEGEKNFDIWIMDADGSRQTQLTVNGSYDTRPAMSPDGRYIYFISNRGARRENDESLQIWRIELIGD